MQISPEEQHAIEMFRTRDLPMIHDGYLPLTAGWKAPKITMRGVADCVEDHFGYTGDWLTRVCKSHALTHARRIVWVIAREQGRSFPEIGNFSKRHHTTILTGCRDFLTGWEDTPEHRADYAAIREELGI